MQSEYFGKYGCFGGNIFSCFPGLKRKICCLGLEVAAWPRAMDSSELLISCDAYTISWWVLNPEQKNTFCRNALIRSNLGQDTEGMNEAQFAEAYCKAVWLESFRLRNQAEMLVAVFGGKNKS